jgi:hypothetical protein
VHGRFVEQRQDRGSDVAASGAVAATVAVEPAAGAATAPAVEAPPAVVPLRSAFGVAAAMGDPVVARVRMVVRHVLSFPS